MFKVNKGIKIPSHRELFHVHTLFIAPESQAIATLTKINTCMNSPVGLPIFFNQYLLQLTKDQNFLFMSCNVCECKGMVIYLSGCYSHEMCY